MDLLLKKIRRRRLSSRTYYYGSFSSSVAKTITFVPVLEKSVKTPLVEETDDGYQRPGSASRMRAFKKFLEQDQDRLIPPVILSARGQWTFNPSPFDDDYGELEIHGRAAIIDGQHRLGGYVLFCEAAGQDVLIDFVAIDSLNKGEEEQEFTDINNSQVGVPKGLTTYLAAGNSLIKSNIDKDYINVAWALNVDQSSPFYGRITRTKLGPEHLFALHSVATQIENMFSHGALVDLDIDTKLSIALKYWNIIQDSHPDQFDDLNKLGISGTAGGRRAFEYKLLELTGFIAWSLIGKTILGGSYSGLSGEMNWDQVERQVEYLSDKIDWSKHGKFKAYTGLVGGPQIKLDMERHLQLL